MTCLVCLQRAGLGPPAASLSCLCKKVSKEHSPCCPRPAGCACGQPASSSSCGCAAQLTSRQAASLRQTAANLMTMQLHSAVQLRATRTCRRRRGHKGQDRMRDSFFGKLVGAIAIFKAPEAGFVATHAGRPYLPVCLRLRHAVRAAGNAAAGQRCIVNGLAAVCLSEAACRAASWAAAQPEWRDAGLPVAKRRDADSRGVFFCLLCLHEQEKKVARRGEIPAWPARPLSLATNLIAVLIAACACCERARG